MWWNYVNTMEIKTVSDVYFQICLRGKMLYVSYSLLCMSFPHNHGMGPHNLLFIIFALFLFLQKFPHNL